MRSQILIATLVSLMVALAASPVGAQLRYIDIWEYQVEGNTLLSRDLVARTVDPYLGVARKIDDTYSAAKALEAEYRAAGFPTVYVTVPEQDVINGVVRLQVTEAKVRRVTISGARYFVLSGIRDDVPSVEEGEVLHVPSLQKDLQSANQANKDLKIVPVITQGPTTDTIDIELSVADRPPLHGGISVSNYNTEGTTPTRASAELSYGNLWQKNHEFGIQAQTSPENTDEVKVLAGSYTFPIGESGSKIALYAVFSDSDLATVSDVNVIGDGEIYGLRYVNPFYQSSNSVQSLSLGFDFKDFEEDLVLLDDSSQQTPISYTSWSALYNVFHKADGLTTKFNAGVTLGIRDLFSDDEEFNEKRSEANNNFMLFSTDFEQTWLLPANWKLRYRVRGQLADSPLVSNEQFSAGGVNTVRGYYEAQIQGDYGLIENLEIETPDFGRGWPGFKSFTMSWFYDAAQLRLREPLPDQENNQKIESSGLALKARLLESIKLDVSSGYAIKEAGEIEKGNVRTRARLSLEF